VKIGGRRIHLGEVRHLALAHADVARAAVGVVETGRQTRIALVAVAGPGAVGADPRDLVRDLRAHLARHLPGYMVPSIIGTADGPALTSSGETDERQLLERLRDAVGPHRATVFALGRSGSFEPVEEETPCTL
jgi:D-alanine--poly(phosphoribitol) ligase subunit 1